MTRNGNVSESTANVNGGIGLFGLTFIVLLLLKAFGVMNISWFVVFLPLIIGTVLFVAIILSVLYLKR